MDRFVVIGGGVAAHRAVLEMCTHSDALITMISLERELPYDRTALSKRFMDDMDALITLPGADAYASRVRFMGGVIARAIDTHTRTVECDDGSRVPYEKLLVATGSRTRMLPGATGAAGIAYLRTLADARALSPHLKQDSRLVIVGGGFIGLELAAKARQSGCSVVVIEAASDILYRVGSPHLARWMVDLHVLAGVIIRPSTQVGSISRLDDGTFEVETSDGVMPADCVAIGIGVIPNVELAQQAGLEVSDGIVVDKECRTSVENVWAAGEVTNYEVGAFRTRTRSESWTSSGEQGAAAGRSMLGLRSSSYDEVPWLWSDMYEHNIQCLGDPRASVTTRIHASDNSRWLELGMDAEGVVVSAIGANAGRHISALRRAFRDKKPLPESFAGMKPVTQDEPLR